MISTEQGYMFQSKAYFERLVIKHNEINEYCFNFENHGQREKKMEKALRGLVRV